MPHPSALSKRHRFPAESIRHAVWLYERLLLRYRAVEELLAERGIPVSYETVRRWGRQFGQAYADGVRRRGTPTGYADGVRRRGTPTGFADAVPDRATRGAWTRCS